MDWSLGFNYDHTTVTRVLPLPSAVSALNTTLNVNQTKFLTAASESYLTPAPPREKLILQALWSKGPWSVNLRETVYNDMSEVVIAQPTNVTERIGATGITDLDIAYRVTKNIRIDVGADNLSNVLPPTTPNINGQPIGNTFVYNTPYGFAPWGPDGGYYYGRISVTF